MKDLDYVYDKFENLILFLEAEVNGADGCDEVLDVKDYTLCIKLLKMGV